MKNKFIKSILLVCMGLLSIGVFLPSRTFAAGPCDASNKGNIPDAVWEATCGNKEDDKNNLTKTITNIINAIVLSAGLIAVIFIVYGGFQYMTSTGDPAKAKKAKDTILYAAIGLIVCALAFAIVNFTINIINNNQSTGEANPEDSSQTVSSING